MSDNITANKPASSDNKTAKRTRKASTRTPNGTGNIRLRSDGRWEARYSAGIDPGTGEYIQRSIYGKTQNEVRKRLQQITVDMDRGLYVEPSKMTVGNWLDTWLKEFKISVKPSTHLAYQQAIKNHLKPSIGAIMLTELNSVTIQKFYNGLTAKGLSAKTVKGIHSVLHAALNQALKLGHIHVNPTKACTLPRIKPADIKPIDSTQVKNFIKQIEGHKYEALFIVTLFTGMREGEALGLTWDCVDLDKGIITVNKQLCRPRGDGDKFHFGTLKNDKSRTIKAASIVIETLKNLRVQQLQNRLLAGPLWDEGDFPGLVFTNETGKHLHYGVVLKHCKKAMKEAGLQSSRFHDLRHSYAVFSIQAGDDFKTIQENLGHHSIAFTMDKYGHVTETMKQASAERMDNFLKALNL